MCRKSHESLEAEMFCIDCPDGLSFGPLEAAWTVWHCKVISAVQVLVAGCCGPSKDRCGPQTQLHAEVAGLVNDA